MAKNPLAELKPSHFTSKISARQWAQMARDKGLKAHAEAWEQAERDGWDELHYRPDPDVRQQFRPALPGRSPHAD